MRDLGLAVRVDAIGNVIGTRAGRRRAAAGHDRLPHRHRAHRWPLRRQPRCARRARGHRGADRARRRDRVRPWPSPSSPTRRAAASPPDMLGSLVYVGGMSLEEALDVVAIDGARLGDELEAIGYAGPTPCPGPAPAAFVELHVEQGPVLEQEGHHDRRGHRGPGHLLAEVTVTGQSNHAGTTPIDHRHDPRLRRRRASPCTCASCARGTGGHQVGTVGKIDVHPNLINVVPGPGHVHRRPAQHRRRRAAPGRGRPLALLRRRRRAPRACTIDVRRLARFDPVAFDPRVVELGRGHRQPTSGTRCASCPSGAGHDAQMFARVCPSGMIFVPVGRGHQPQPGRAHRARPTSPPAPTPCCRPCSASPASPPWAGLRRSRLGPRSRSPPCSGGPMTRLVTVGAAQLGPDPARPLPQGRRRAPPRPAAPGRRARLRPRRVPRARPHHLLPPLVHHRRGRARPWYETRDARARRPRPLFDEAARLGVGFSLGYAELKVDEATGERHRYNAQVLVERDGAVVGTLPQGAPARPRRARAVAARSSTSRSATSSPAPTASGCGGPSAASSAWPSATTGAGPRPTG